MSAVLFVSNGHGEIAIAGHIAAAVQSRTAAACDHLALVGDFAYPSTMRDVGPRRSMPSGGVVAMGNVRNIARDVKAGLISHTLAQLRFLRAVRGTYSVAVAVGDVFALVMALQARATATVFVGTAKSVYVAPYGALEERVLRRADAVFVRDAATTQMLGSHGIPATAANAIVDLYASPDAAIDTPFRPQLAIFPGSRASAYDDAVFMARVMRAIAAEETGIGGVLSIAPGLDADRMCTAFARDGWRVERRDDEAAPFSLFSAEREVLRAWTGPLGAMLRRAALVLGQAGTANEAAAAMGIPVVSFARSPGKRTPWYRMRQIGLLGEAMFVANGDPKHAAFEVLDLLHDAQRRERMGRIGRERMGEPGAAQVIAGCVAGFVQS